MNSIGQHDIAPQNIWQHRIAHHKSSSYPLIEDHHILSFGFASFANAAFVEAVADREDWNAYSDELTNQGYLPIGRFNRLWNFIVEMKKGDWVVVPLDGGLFSVYRLLTDRPLIPTGMDATRLPATSGEGERIWVDDDGLLCEGDNAVDLGFFREVEPIAVDMERSKYADSRLTSRMKVPHTTLNIGDLKDSVERAIARKEDENPIDLYTDIIHDSAQSVLNRIRENLNADRFESLVRWYLTRVGATSTKSPAKNAPGKSGDADIIAHFKPLRTMIYVQAKYHYNPAQGETGVDAVEQIIDYIEHKQDDTGAQIGWVVSANDKYSEEALEKARENNIELIGGLEFATMLLEAGIADLDLGD